MVLVRYLESFSAAGLEAGGGFLAAHTDLNASAMVGDAIAGLNNLPGISIPAINVSINASDDTNSTDPADIGGAAMAAVLDGNLAQKAMLAYHLFGTNQCCDTQPSLT